MGFGDAIRTCFHKYTDFRGRAGRGEYWWFWLLTFLVGAIPGWFNFGSEHAFGSVLGWLSWLVSLALIIPGLAVAVRRLHDIGKSGWWLLVVLIPIVGPIWYIILLATRGTPAPNQYGPPPGQPMPGAWAY